jgi:3-deoxy-D-manno-octulosonic-acid transferase
MLWLYRLIFIPALVLMAPGYLLRMRRRGGYGQNFSHRFGAYAGLLPRRAGTTRIWLQAVSVGEILAIGPILEALRSDGIEIFLTTTTSTGYRLAHERYHRHTAGIGYFPIDWWPFSARAWRQIAPDMAIITEGERWPEHLRQAGRRGVPVLCINARLSDRSYWRLRRFPAAARMMLHGVTKLLPGSAQDEARFVELGMSRDRIVTTGNIKLDVQIPALTGPERDELRRALGVAPGRLVVLGSSTWAGEEEALLRAWRQVCARGLDCTLLIVPRHAERRDEIARLLEPSGLRHHFRSRGTAAVPVDIVVADTTGELRHLTQLADLVFVGKSLPPHKDGQTPVEAATLEKPILFGPGMGNFREIAQDLLIRGAAREVSSADALADDVEALLREPAKRAALSAAAGQWRRDNVGAVSRTLDVIRHELPRRVA